MRPFPAINQSRSRPKANPCSSVSRHKLSQPVFVLCKRHYIRRCQITLSFGIPTRKITGHGILDPFPGSDPKLSNPAERYVIISFAYGTNMGAAQLAKHMRGIVTEHEITFANRRHITSEKLEAAKADLINRYHLYDLPKRWGDENIAAADGTQIGVPTFFPGVSPAKQERKERATEVFGERMSLLQASLGSTGRGKRGLPRNLAGSRWLFGVSRPKIEIRVKLGHRGNRQKR